MVDLKVPKVRPLIWLLVRTKEKEEGGKWIALAESPARTDFSINIVIKGK